VENVCPICPEGYFFRLEYRFIVQSFSKILLKLFPETIHVRGCIPLCIIDDLSLF